MAVNVFNAPAKGFKAIAIDSNVMAKSRFLALAQSVGIHNRDQIVQLDNTRPATRPPKPILRRFRHRPSVHTYCNPIGRDAPASAMPTPAPKPCPSEPVATSTNCRPRRRMPFELAVELPELEQFIDRHETVFSPCRIKQRSGMAFGENKAIVIVIARILRVILHVPEKQARPRRLPPNSTKWDVHCLPRSWH